MDMDNINIYFIGSPNYILGTAQFGNNKFHFLSKQWVCIALKFIHPSTFSTKLACLVTQVVLYTVLAIANHSSKLIAMRLDLNTADEYLV